MQQYRETPEIGQSLLKIFHAAYLVTAKWPLIVRRRDRTINALYWQAMDSTRRIERRMFVQRAPPAMEPHPLFGRAPDDFFKARRQQTSQAQSIALQVPAGMIRDRLHCYFVYFAAPMVPTKYHRRARPQRQRSRARRRKRRPAEKVHVIAGRVGILIDQEPDQVIGPKQAHNGLCAAVPAPDDFKTALASPAIEPASNPRIEGGCRHRGDRISGRSNRLCEDFPVADVARNENRAVPSLQSNIKHLFRRAIEPGHRSAQPRELP